MTALTNTRIVIRCDASGVPTPSITWTKDGQTIFSDQQYKVMDNGSLLIIKKVKESANRYMCTAISASGQDSASSMVEIFGRLCSELSQEAGQKKVAFSNCTDAFCDVFESTEAGINVFTQADPPPKDRHLVVVGGLECLGDPRAMPAGASSPGRATQSPTKHDPPVLQVKGVGTGLPTLSRKTPMLRKGQKKKKPKKTALRATRHNGRE